jgi:hypothetical protein
MGKTSCRRRFFLKNFPDPSDNQKKVEPLPYLLLWFRAFAFMGYDNPEIRLGCPQQLFAKGLLPSSYFYNRKLTLADEELQFMSDEKASSGQPRNSEICF